MELSIIVVSFNTKQITQKCLYSIISFLTNKCTFEVIIVDNNSTDGSIEMLKEYAKDERSIQLILSKENLGFGRANNLGIRKAKGRYILFLNSDAFFIDDSLVSAIKYLDTQKDIGGCGCTLLNKDGSLGVSYGKFPEAVTLFREVFTNRFCSLRAISPKEKDLIINVDFPCGAFFLIKAEVLKKVGEFDEKYFMYFEETDLAKRVWKAGYKIILFGPTQVVHLGGQSSKADNSKEDSFNYKLKLAFYQSWNYYLKRHCFYLECQSVKYLLLLYFYIHIIGNLILQRNKAVINTMKKEIKVVLSAWNSGEDVYDERCN